MNGRDRERLIDRMRRLGRESRDEFGRALDAAARGDHEEAKEHFRTSRDLERQREKLWRHLYDDEDEYED